MFLFIYFFEHGDIGFRGVQSLKLYFFFSKKFMKCYIVQILDDLCAIL